jgi:pyrimidine-nucleoside phosphorylase
VARREVPAAQGGVVTGMRTRELGMLAIEIGCGRARKDDVIDPASGLRFSKKTGDRVAPGDVLCVVELGPSARPSPDYLERVAACFEVGEGPANPLPLIVKTL